MYYKLKQHLVLRGWEKLNTGVVDTLTGRTKFLPKDLYRTLLKCNGLFSSDFMLFNDKDRANFVALEQQGLVEGFIEQQKPLRKEQEYKQFNNRYIASAHWSITGRCNYRCRHCYMNAPTGKLGELTLEQCKTIIDGFARCGIYSVSLTGGEPLIHPHFWEIVEYLVNKKICITQIYSNGFLINEAFFEKCSELGVKPEIALSFDGTEGQHEWLRNVPDARMHLERALRLCQKYGFSTFVEYCLHKGNRHCVRDSINYLDKFGVHNFKLYSLMVKGEGVNLAAYALSDAEIWDTVMQYLSYYKADRPKMIVMLQGLVLKQGKYACAYCKHVPKAGIDNYCICGHARNYMHIEASGRALPCNPITNAEQLVAKFPNLLETSMEKVLSDSFYMEAIGLTLKDFVEHNQECASCPHILNCVGGCRGIAASMSGVDHYYAKDESVCYIFKQGIHEKVKVLCAELGIEHGN